MRFWLSVQRYRVIIRSIGVSHSSIFRKVKRITKSLAFANSLVRLQSIVEDSLNFREEQKMLEIVTNVHLEMLLRLLIAAILGLLIGLERELKRKSLGLKTILVISIVSCLLTIVSIQSAYLLPGSALAEIRMDPLRLAAQIVTGVGFLGAGVILRREDDTISGLTTAAIVWGAAGIGVAIGAGFYIEAIVGVGLLLISVEIIPYIIFRLGFEQLKLKEFQIAVTLNSRENIEEIVEQIEREVVKLGKVNIKDEQVNSYVIEVEVKVYQDVKPTELYQKLTKIKNIDLIELNS